MTAQALKNSILQLAMQGKLVPQDPSDEPASELLKKVKAEKTLLIKEGKIRKEKSQPAISKDEIPFDIPESWAWVRLGSAFSTVMGQSPEGSSVTEIEGGIEFHQGKIFFTDEIIAPSPQRTSKPTKIAPSGSILLCVRAPVGKVNITNRTICIGRGLAAIVTNGGISNKFTYYMLQTLETVFNQKATGSTFKAISSAIISNQVVPIPPISEQERIVAKIEELLPFIERYDESEKRLLELNKKFPDELRKAILQQAVQGKLTEQDPHDEPASELLKKIKAEKARLIKEGKIKKEKPLMPISEDEIPFDIPEGWEWVRLSQIVYNLGQKNPDEEFCYIDVGSIDNYAGRLSETNTLIKPENAPSRARKVVVYGAILYSCVRPYLLNTCIVDREFPRPPIASTAFAVLMPYEGIYNKYLHLYLRSPSFVLYTNFTSTGQAYPAINDKRLYDAVIPIPPFEEQKRIVASVERLLPLCDSLK